MSDGFAELRREQSRSHRLAAENTVLRGRLDEASALRYEWRQLDDFGPADWRDVLEGDRPDLLFVESAWEGNGGRWARHVNGSSAPSRELTNMHLTATGAIALRLPERHVEAVREGTVLGRGDVLRDHPFEGGDPEQHLFRMLRADGIGIYAADRYSFVAVHHGEVPPDDARVVFYGSPEQHVLI